MPTTQRNSLNINNSELYVDGQLIGVINEFRPSDGLITKADVEALLHDFGVKKFTITTGQEHAFDSTMIDTVEYAQVKIKIKSYRVRNIDQIKSVIDQRKSMGVVYYICTLTLKEYIIQLLDENKFLRGIRLRYLKFIRSRPKIKLTKFDIISG
jgi:predicted peroxiredoxin